MTDLMYPLGLIDPRSMENERRTRMEVLHDTIARFKDPAERQRLQLKGLQNLARWSKDSCLASPDGQCKVVVEQGDLLDTVLKYTRMHGKLYAALNMANEFYPGGGYREGCVAQEENMARRTDMHYTFTSYVVAGHKNRLCYTKPMRDLISGKHGLVYLSEHPLICIKGREEVPNQPSKQPSKQPPKQSSLQAIPEAEDEPPKEFGYALLPETEIFPFLELRSAALDLRQAKQETARRLLGRDFKFEVTTSEMADLAIWTETRARIDAQFRTLVLRGIRHVVLSAFGCGAFKNDASVVASLYKEVLLEYMQNGFFFESVVFAVYHAGYGPNNYDIFYQTLNGLESKVCV